MAMSSMELLEVSTTLDDEGAARQLAQSLVQARLAACVHLSPVHSVYRWNDAVEQASEWQLVCKTTERCYDALEAAILAAHPYDLPAIHAVPVRRAHGPFAAWVAACTTPTPS